MVVFNFLMNISYIIIKSCGQKLSIYSMKQAKVVVRYVFWAKVLIFTLDGKKWD